MIAAECHRALAGDRITRPTPSSSSMTILARLGAAVATVQPRFHDDRSASAVRMISFPDAEFARNQPVLTRSIEIAPETSGHHGEPFLSHSALTDAPVRIFGRRAPSERFDFEQGFSVGQFWKTSRAKLADHSALCGFPPNSFAFIAPKSPALELVVMVLSKLPRWFDNSCGKVRANSANASNYEPISFSTGSRGRQFDASAGNRALAVIVSLRATATTRLGRSQHRKGWGSCRRNRRPEGGRSYRYRRSQLF